MYIVNRKSGDAVITKETFCNVLALIKEQDEINEQFNKALDLVGNGHFVYGAENKYLKGLLLLIKEAMDDKYDYVGWWLYDATDDYTVYTEDCSRSWCLKEPEALYEFIINECK